MSWLPDVRNFQELDQLRHQPERWRPSVDRLLDSLGFSGAELRNLGGGNLVLAINESHVIKLVPPLCANELTVEIPSLRIAGSSLPWPVPELCASGSWGSWSYMVMSKIAGQSMHDVLSELPMEQKLRITHEIGQWLAALHQLPVTETLPDCVPTWEQYLAQEQALSIERQRAWGVPDGIVAGMAACLEEANLSLHSERCFLHADLHDANVMVDNVEGQWRITSVIDFGDAMVGEPLFDLLTPAMLIARGDRQILSALLDGYGIPVHERNRELQTRLSAYAILHRYNNLKRYLHWSDPQANSFEEFRHVMLPIAPLG
jgi:hygromycin-B 7''-O-kinase